MTIYIIFIIVGSLVTIIALADLKGRLKFLRTGEKAIGTVVKLVEKKDDDGVFYFPVFNITTRQQEIITYSPGTGTSSAAWQVGDTAAFIFEPGKPETLRFLKYRSIFWTSIIAMAVGVDLLLIGAGYFLLRSYFA
jgi:hypothetical protein